MSTRRINSYSFASDAQWNRCLAVGFGAPDGNGMSLPPRLGTHARRIGGKEPCTAIAADSFGTPFWRATIANGEEGISWRDEFDRLFGPFPLDHVVAETRRLQADRYGLWAFAPDRVIRHDRASLQRDMTIPAAAMSAADSTTILDIAVDGRGGLWVLLDETRGQRLVHVDCRGCVGAVWAVPCEIQGAMELAVVDSGRILALLSPKDRRLAVVDAADGKLMRMLWLGALDACFEPTRIASNAADCLVLSGIREGRHGQEWCLFALDRFGEPTRPALSDIFRAPDMRRLAEAVQVFDFAVARDRIWFATSGGLWILDASPASGSMGAKAVLLTPLLHAPPDGEAPGWLRAEIEIDLPEGAGVTASFATAQDARLAGRIAMIEADESQPRHVRQDSIWSLLDRGKSGERRFTAASGPDFPGRLSIPIFGTDHPWLAVKLDIDVPPFVSAPRLKSMRVLYPEQTLMRSLPAIFAHPDHDPERVLRRLVGVIEATSQAIDEKIDSIGSLIDYEGAPRHWLDYLGSWLDLPWHAALAESSKRALLREAGFLLRWRGTRRGLLRLLECLAGDGARVSVIDVAADRAPVRLGESPAGGLLAGRRRTAVTLGRKSVLGRVRLGCPGEAEGPLDILVPLLLIAIEGDAAIKAINAPYLGSVLAQYAPVGVRHRVRWEVTGARNAEDADALILDARGPGKLGTNSMIGRTVLGGRTRKEIGTGFEMGFQIR